MSERQLAPIDAVADALKRLAVVDDVTTITAQDSPANERTVEVTTNPDLCEDILPYAVALTVYNSDADWFHHVGIATVEKRSPLEGHLRVVIR